MIALAALLGLLALAGIVVLAAVGISWALQALLVALVILALIAYGVRGRGQPEARR